LAVVSHEASSIEELTQLIKQHSDLGESWPDRLQYFIEETTIEKLGEIEVGGYAEFLDKDKVDCYIDDRKNYLPEQKVFCADIYVSGDGEKMPEESFVESYFVSSKCRVVVETEPRGA
jgi:hypothetical protein